jgi:hypothetical protein
VTAVPVELRQDQMCLFRQGDYRNKGRKLKKKTILGSSPDDASCSSETKHDRKTALKPNLFVSAKRVHLKKSHNHDNLSLVRVPVKMVSVITVHNSVKANAFAFGTIFL